MSKRLAAGSDIADVDVDMSQGKRIKSEPYKTDRNHTSDGRLVVPLLIPEAVAGVVIGKKGDTVANLRARHQCDVALSNKQEFYPGTDLRFVFIRGDPVGCAAVAIEVQQLIKQTTDSSSHNAKWTDPFDEPMASAVPKHLQMRFVVANGNAGAIIGKKGVKLQDIYRTTQCRVTLLPKVSPTSNTAPRVVSVCAHTMDQLSSAAHLLFCELFQQWSPGDDIAGIPKSPFGQQQQTTAAVWSTPTAQLDRIGRALLPTFSSASPLMRDENSISSRWRSYGSAEMPMTSSSSPAYLVPPQQPSPLFYTSNGGDQQQYESMSSWRQQTPQPAASAAVESMSASQTAETLRMIVAQITDHNSAASQFVPAAAEQNLQPKSSPSDVDQQRNVNALSSASASTPNTAAGASGGIVRKESLINMTSNEIDQVVKKLQLSLTTTGFTDASVAQVTEAIYTLQEFNVIGLMLNMAISLKRENKESL